MPADTFTPKRFCNPDPVDLSRAAQDRQWHTTLDALQVWIDSNRRLPTRNMRPNDVEWHPEYGVSVVADRAEVHLDESRLKQWLSTQRRLLRNDSLAAWRKAALDEVAAGWTTVKPHATDQDLMARAYAFAHRTGALPSLGSNDRDEAILGRWVDKKARTEQQHSGWYSLCSEFLPGWLELWDDYTWERVHRQYRARLHYSNLDGDDHQWFAANVKAEKAGQLDEWKIEALDREYVDWRER
jgi:hypothetical protein